MSDLFLGTAHALAARLAAAAERGAGGPRWTGADVAGTEADWSIVTVDVGDDVYGGRAGLAWFLALAAGSGAPDRDSLRDLAVDASRAAMSAPPMPGSGHGLLVGDTGRVIAALDVARRLDDPLLLAEGVERAGTVVATAEADLTGGEERDLLGGIAGTVLGLLHLAPDVDGAVDAAVALGDRLLSAADKNAWGWSWPSPSATGEPALCGLAHGASGTALALQHLAHATRHPRFAEGAREAARYERSWFSVEASNWPDLRRSAVAETSVGPTYPVFWCHGGAGIGLARLHAASLAGEDWAWAEATSAVNAGRVAVAEARHHHASGAMVDQSLCHGLGGVIELFLSAAEVTGRPEHLRAARRSGEVSLATSEAAGGVFGCGLPDRREVPGLFLGLAGIGVTLLRLHDPSLAPSPALFGVPAVTPG